MDAPAKIDLGSVTIALLTDGFWHNDGGCMFGVVPRELWHREHPPDEHNRIRLNLICPLIIRGNEAVLVDTGIGNRLSEVERKIFDHGEGWLRDGLARLGMEPGDVTCVVLSHLHFDHAGGIVRRRASGGFEAAFARARVVVQAGELEVARSSRNERLRAAYRHVPECLQPVAQRLEPVSGTVELMPGVRAVVTGGHTHDHQVVTVETERGSFVHLADIVPTRSHMRGPWNQAYDLDALRTMEEQERYLSRAGGAENGWLSFAHDDRLLAARVRREPGRYLVVESVTAREDGVAESGGV